MEMLDITAFERRLAVGWKPRMDTSIYQQLPFECACGETHLFGDAFVLKELGMMRLVLTCPTLRATATCVKVRGFFRRRLMSEFGCGAPEDPDAKEGPA